MSSPAATRVVEARVEVERTPEQRVADGRVRVAPISDREVVA